MSVRDPFQIWCRQCRQGVRVADRRFTVECPRCGNAIPAEQPKVEGLPKPEPPSPEPSSPMLDHVESIEVILGDE
jgi:hypothetical protein